MGAEPARPHLNPPLHTVCVVYRGEAVAIVGTVDWRLQLFRVKMDSAISNSKDEMT